MIARVEVLWEDQPGTPMIEPGLVEDASFGGAGIHLDKPLPVGTNLTIRVRQQDYPGIVRHCRPAGGGYFAGIEWTGPSAPWARRRG